MNLLLFEEGELAEDGSLIVQGRRARHLLDILKVSVGSKVRVGRIRKPMTKAFAVDCMGPGLDSQGRYGFAKVCSVSEEIVSLQIDEESTGGEVMASSPIDLPLGEGPCDLSLDEGPWFDLFLALPRPRMLGRILTHVASLGVRRIVLFPSERVEKSYFSSSLLKPEALRKKVLLGLEQALLTEEPEVLVCKSWTEVLSDYFPINGPGFIFDHRASRDLSSIAKSDLSSVETPVWSKGCLAVAVGPEGGMREAELEAFEEGGFHRVRSGTRVLRVEAAVTSVIAQLDLLRRLAAA